MLLSFFTLALTGMALKFSYMGWAQGCRLALGGFDTMGVLHRIGAVVLFVRLRRPPLGRLASARGASARRWFAGDHRPELDHVQPART